MQSLEEIKRKIDSTGSLKSIIRTMKILAAVGIRQYERILISLEKYNQTIELSFQAVLKYFRKNNPYFTGKIETKRKYGVIIFGSDLGMCGQFNEQIASFAFQNISALNINHDGAFILAVGEKVITRIEDTGYRITENIFYPAGLETGIVPVLNELILVLEKWHKILDIENVLLFYNKPREDLINYVPHMHRLLPIDPGYLLELRERKWESGSLPVFKMDKNKLLSALIRSHLYVELYKSFVESLTGENAARLVSMQAAEKHIDEHLDELKGQYNAERQENITSELLDIIAGFEAMTT